jgi:hypothetical protein
MNNSQEKKDTHEEAVMLPEDIHKQIESITNAKEEREKVYKAGMRTFEGDIAERVRQKDTSVASIALAEQQRKETGVKIKKQQKKQSTVSGILALVLLVSGIILFFVALSARQQGSVIVQFSPSSNSIIFSNDQIPFDASGLSRSRFISSMLNLYGTVSREGVTNLVPFTISGQNASRLTAFDFANLLSRNLPENFRQVFTDEFMHGVFVQNSQQYVFTIFRISDISFARTLMREWEDFLLEDMQNVYNIGPISDSLLYSKSFESEIILNKESRILKDDNQRTVIVYTFLDNATIVITTNRDALREVHNRFTNRSIAQ